jgi:ribosome modulation factor
MPTYAADDTSAIRRGVEYERGFAACMAGAIREVPDGCMDRVAWLEGWDEAKRKKPAS